MEEVLQYGVDGMVTYWQLDSFPRLPASKSIAYWLRHLYYVNRREHQKHRVKEPRLRHWRQVAGAGVLCALLMHNAMVVQMAMARCQGSCRAAKDRRRGRAMLRKGRTSRGREVDGSAAAQALVRG